MSEVKRVEFTPLAAPDSSTIRTTNKKSKNRKPAVRIKVNLPESTEDTCPEFNFKDELLTRTKEMCNNKEINAFGDDDDSDVRRIAQQMEEKYGTGVPGNRKKRKNHEFEDIGMGYDESDSFIDNTDGYDEIVPPGLTTVHGGFYINCGQLDFKYDEEASSDDDSSSPEDNIPNKTKRKRILELASEDSDDDDDDKKSNHSDSNHKKAKLLNPPNSMQQAMKKKLLGSKMQIKKKTNLQKKTVKDLIREKRRDLNMSDLKDTSMDVIVINDVEDTKKASSITETIESVVKAVANTVKADSSENTFKAPREESDKSPVSSTTGTVSIPEEPQQSNEKNVTPSSLPQNLPSDVLELITSLRNSIDGCQNQKNFPSSNVDDKHINDLLLSLEKKCKCLGKPSKLKIYEYLASVMNCNKDALIAHSKNLILRMEESRIKHLISKLRLEIEHVMPKLVTRYEEDCQQVSIQRQLANDDSKVFKLPKRRYQWSDGAKKIVQDIIRIKKKCFLLEERPRSNLEKMAISYLKSNIQILWPEGWMSMTNLMRVTNLTSEKDAAKNNTKEPSKEASKEPPKDNHSKPKQPVITSVAKSEGNSLEERVAEEKHSNSTAPVSTIISTVNSVAKPDKTENATFVQSKSTPKVEENTRLQEKTNHDNKLNDKFVNNPKQPHQSDPIDIVAKNNSKNSNSKPAEYHNHTLLKRSYEGNDIQKVMEDLKVLQKMSSAYTLDSCTSSQVSVIKTISPKHTPYEHSDSADDSSQKDCMTGFQEEFQKQFLDSRGHDSLNSKLYHCN